MNIAIETLNHLYKNKEVNPDKLASLFSDNHNGEYIAYCAQDIPHEPFGITPILFESWEYKGIELNVYLHIKDNAITFVDVRKYRTVYESHYKSDYEELSPTNQEYRIARRVIEAVIKE